MNKRVIALTVAAIFVIILVCLGLFTAFMPKVNRKIATQNAQTATEQAIQIKNTQTKSAATEQAEQTITAATAHAVQTLTAIPPTSTITPTYTLTPTLTHTPTLTSTPTATQAAEVIPCLAEITQTTRMMYTVPGGGRLFNAQELAKGTQVEVIGRLEDRGWYQARYNQKVGWLRSDFVSDLGTCVPNTYALSHLLGLLNPGVELYLEDVFAGNANSWTGNDGELALPVQNEFGDYQLELSTQSIYTVAPENPELDQDLSAFRVLTSFSRENIDQESYVGIRFRSTGDRYYEVRILTGVGKHRGMCKVKIFETNELFYEQLVDPGENSCGSGDLEDYLEISLSQDYNLEIRINDSDPFHVTLRDPNGLYARGGIELVAHRVITKFSYLIITIPR